VARHGYNVTRLARKHRRLSQDLAAFASDIASPFDLGAGLVNAFTMPANGRLGISVDDAFNDGDLTVTVNGTARGASGGVANEVRTLGWFERDAALSVASSVTGAVTLYVLDQYGAPRAIATGTVS